jgi:hypothetical protein
MDVMTTVAAFAPYMALAAEGPGENSFMSGLVSWAAGIGGAIIALFLIYAIVKDGIGYAKGNGSVFPIIGKVLFLILCIGLIFIAINYNKLGQSASNIADKGVNVVQEQAGEIMP